MNEQHEKFGVLLTKLVEGAANEADRGEIEAHLGSCTECQTALDSQRRSKNAMVLETKAFAEGFDAGRLEANLSHELRSGLLQIRWLLALGTLSSLLTIGTFIWPPRSQPEAWSALFPLTVGFFGALYWALRRQAQFRGVARAAEGGRSGYQDLELARVRIMVRDFRMAGRLGLFAPIIPALVGLSGFLNEVRLRQAFPHAEVRVHIFGALVNTGVLSVVLLAASLYFLWKARQLEKSTKTSGDDGTPDSLTKEHP